MTVPGDDADRVRRRQSERSALLARACEVAEADPRILALWLWGSGVEGFRDQWSDLDLGVVVRDDAFEAVAGGPARPIDQRASLAPARVRWVGQIAEPLWVLEAPQNAPAGGAFLSVFFPGDFGPHEVDWVWSRASSVEPSDDARMLFQRGGFELSAGSVESVEPVGSAAALEPSGYEVVAHAVPWFWSSVLWAGKYVARNPLQARVPMMTWARRALGDVERFVVGDSANAAAAELVEDVPVVRLTDRIAELRGLVGGMERLLTQAPELCTGGESGVARALEAYLQGLPDPEGPAR